MELSMFGSSLAETPKLSVGLLKGFLFNVGLIKHIEVSVFEP